jgi:haloalkane dehalogenase
MSTTHQEFRRGQRVVGLSGLGPLDLDMAYTDTGAGEPVVLLHGIPTWSYLYVDVIPRLAEHCRVVAPDLLGYGWSDRRDRFDRSLPAQTAAVLRLLDALDIERATFVGHDIGGGVALILGIEHPDRVERLVLTNAVAYDSWPIEDMVALGDPTWGRKPAGEVAAFVSGGLPDGVHRPERLTREFVEGIVAPYVDEDGALSLVRDASALNTNHTTSLVDRHQLIAAPTLLLWGRHDPWQPLSDGVRLSQEIPDARLVPVDASHWVPYDAPIEFSDAVVEFLRASSRTSRTAPGDA